MFDSNLGPAPRRRFTELSRCLGRAKPRSSSKVEHRLLQVLHSIGYSDNAVNLHHETGPYKRPQLSTLWNQPQDCLASFILTYFRRGVLFICLLLHIFPLTNTCCFAILSSLPFITPPPPLSLSSQGVADLSLLCKLNNSSLVSVRLCVYACVSNVRDHPGDVVLGGWKAAFWK